MRRILLSTVTLGVLAAAFVLAAASTSEAANKGFHGGHGGHGGYNPGFAPGGCYRPPYHGGCYRPYPYPFPGGGYGGGCYPQPRPYPYPRW